jgi:hypothetical protein
LYLCARLRAQPDGLDDVIGQGGAIGDGVERGHAQLILDDVDADRVVRGGARDDGRSMLNFSRSSLTPPQAATGSFADSTTEVSASRMSGEERIASTP